VEFLEKKQNKIGEKKWEGIIPWSYLNGALRVHGYFGS
jgi:hypothetical protein